MHYSFAPGSALTGHMRAQPGHSCRAASREIKRSEIVVETDAVDAWLKQRGLGVLCHRAGPPAVNHRAIILQIAHKCGHLPGRIGARRDEPQIPAIETLQAIEFRVVEGSCPRIAREEVTHSGGPV